MSNTNASFLKEMGITTWVGRDSSGIEEVAITPAEQTSTTVNPSAENTSPRYQWWFIGDQAQGDSQLLLQNIVRLLGLTSHEWSWLKPSDKLNIAEKLNPDVPSVAIAFGGPAAQKITGERDPLNQLRETVLAMNGDGLEDIPVLATFDLSHLINRPKDKALLWQDLLLAKSVLHSL
jgi:DNA polymerase